MDYKEIKDLSAADLSSLLLSLRLQLRDIILKSKIMPQELKKSKSIRSDISKILTRISSN